MESSKVWFTVGSLGLCTYGLGISLVQCVGGMDTSCTWWNITPVFLACGVRGIVVVS